MLKYTKIILIGDAIILALMTFYGLASHEVIGGIPARFASTFLPWLLAWLIVGKFADLFNPRKEKMLRVAGRTFLGMLIASPMAGLFRGIFIGEDIVIIFVVVFGGLSAILITIWRVIFHLKMKGWILDG